jgi:hypothetical protein
LTFFVRNSPCFIILRSYLKKRHQSASHMELWYSA